MTRGEGSFASCGLSCSTASDGPETLQFSSAAMLSSTSQQLLIQQAHLYAQRYAAQAGPAAPVRPGPGQTIPVRNPTQPSWIQKLVNKVTP